MDLDTLSKCYKSTSIQDYQTLSNIMSNYIICTLIVLHIWCLMYTEISGHTTRTVSSTTCTWFDSKFTRHRWLIAGPSLVSRARGIDALEGVTNALMCSSDRKPGKVLALLPFACKITRYTVLTKIYNSSTNSTTNFPSLATQTWGLLLPRHGLTARTQMFYMALSTEPQFFKEAQKTQVPHQALLPQLQRCLHGSGCQC